MSMISELVDRLRTEAKSMGTYGTDYMATLLMKSADTIEMLSEKAREPKQGEWLVKFPYREDGNIRTCSVCCVTQSVNNYRGNIQFRFCPYCGARMKGADDDQE